MVNYVFEVCYVFFFLRVNILIIGVIQFGEMVDILVVLVIE